VAIAAILPGEGLLNVCEGGKKKRGPEGGVGSVAWKCFWEPKPGGPPRGIVPQGVFVKKEKKTQEHCGGVRAPEKGGEHCPLFNHRPVGFSSTMRGVAKGASGKKKVPLRKGGARPKENKSSGSGSLANKGGGKFWKKKIKVLGVESCRALEKGA